MNQGPPSTIEAPDLFAMLTTLPRPFITVDFPRSLPGTDKPIGRLALRVLTPEEQQFAAARADEYTKTLLRVTPKRDEASQSYDDCYHNESAVQLALFACRKPENPAEPTFKAANEIRRLLTSDELGVVCKHYYRAQLELGPIVATMTPETAKAWVIRLVEGASAYPLDLLPSELKDTLLQLMACLLYPCLTGTSSPTAPRESSTTDSPPAPTTPFSDSTISTTSGTFALSAEVTGYALDLAASFAKTSVTQLLAVYGDCIARILAPAQPATELPPAADGDASP